MMAESSKVTNVVYDGRMLCFNYTGLGRYSAELLFSLLQNSKSWNIRYTVVLYKHYMSDNPYYCKLKHLESQGQCSIVYSKAHPVSLIQHIGLSLMVNRLNPDIYFHPHFDLPILIKMPSIIVVHDLFPLMVSGYIVKSRHLKKLYFKFLLKYACFKARLVYAVSNTTKSDLIKYLGPAYQPKIGVTLEGPIVSNSLVVDSTLERFFDSHGKYLLYVGDRRPHKNLKRIIELFNLLKERGLYLGKLYLAGSKKNFDFDLETYIADMKDIVILGNVSDRDLLELYKNMDSLIFLSKYEGFGLPVLEASLMERRVIISDMGALKEIAPSWAFVVPENESLENIVDELGGYLKSLPLIDSNYGLEYKWPLIASKVSKDIVSLASKKNVG